MEENNIWKNFSFNEEEQKSAKDFLDEFKAGLTEQTGGELRLLVEVSDAYIEEEPVRLAAVYKLFVEAPKLGNFRRKILTVTEHSDTGRFPVDIYNNFSETPLKGINEEEFKLTIERILDSRIVKTSIENLYRRSKEYNKQKELVDMD